MAALTGDLQAPFKHKGPIRACYMAATTRIFAGAIVGINAGGFAVPATDAAGLIIIGRSEEQVDNLAGGNGDKVIRVASGIFRYLSTGASKLVLGDVGRFAYVLDDQTIVKTAGTTNAIVAGRVWAPGVLYKEPVDTFYISIGDNAL